MLLARGADPPIAAGDGRDRVRIAADDGSASVVSMSRVRNTAWPAPRHDLPLVAVGGTGAPGCDFAVPDPE